MDFQSPHDSLFSYIKEIRLRFVSDKSTQFALKGRVTHNFSKLVSKCDLCFSYCTGGKLEGRIKQLREFM